MTQLERKTFVRHLLFAALNGIGFGVTVTLQEVVAWRVFDASATQVTILYMTVHFAMLSSVFFTGTMQKFKRHSGILIAAGIIRIIAMSSIFFVQNAWQFIIAMWVFQLPLAVVNPAQNFILAKNYPSSSRGIRFGISVSVMNFFAIVASFAAGVILDINDMYFKYIFFGVGIITAVSIFSLASIPTKNRMMKTVGNPFRDMIKIFRTNRGFWKFQRNFFIYGVAFLILGPVIPIFMVDVLNMSYTEISIARGIIAYLGIAVFAPFSGKALDKHNPFLHAARAFAILALFPLFFLVSYFGGKWFVFAAYGFYSLAMAGVSIIWNLGSTYFSEHDREATYQSVHLTMTGIRGLSAPLFGLLTLSVFGFNTTFGLSAAIFLLAAFLMFRASRNEEL